MPFIPDPNLSVPFIRDPAFSGIRQLAIHSLVFSKLKFQIPLDRLFLANFAWIFIANPNMIKLHVIHLYVYSMCVCVCTHVYIISAIYDNITDLWIQV